MKTTVTIIALIGLASCASVLPEETLTPSAVNHSPQVHAGHPVLVRGYLSLGSEAHVMFESRELSDKVRAGWGKPGFDPREFVQYCLTIANPRLLLENKDWFDGRTIVVKGEVEPDYRSRVFDLGACVGEPALRIDESDLRRRYGRFMSGDR